jgi:heterodisulfide reductase subunit C
MNAPTQVDPSASGVSPPPTARHARPVSPDGRAAPDGRRFLDEIRAAIGTDARLEACIQCGTCGGSCPSADAMDHTPRALFALIRAGMREDVLRSSTPWMCVACYLCVVRCPQEVRIPDVMYALKGIAVREGLAPDATAPGFSRTFVDNIHAFGRSYEVGLVARHYLRHFPLRLPGLAPASIGMVTSGRMALRPHRIRGVKRLRAILERAAELERQP